MTNTPQVVLTYEAIFEFSVQFRYFWTLLDKVPAPTITEQCPIANAESKITADRKFTEETCNTMPSTGAMYAKVQGPSPMPNNNPNTKEPKYPECLVPRIFAPSQGSLIIPIRYKPTTMKIIETR